MSSLETTTIFESLHPNIMKFISNSMYDEFIVGYRIPDSFVNFKCTWFLLFETELVIVDSVRPFRVADKFSILESTVEEVENKELDFIRVCRDNAKDLYIPLDSDNPQSRRFSSIMSEHVNTIVNEERVSEDRLSM